jgi:hypothetical protein
MEAPMFKIDKRLTASAVALFVLAGPQVQASERTQTTTTFDRSGDKDPATNKGGYDDQVLTGIATPNRRAGGKTPQGLTTKKRMVKRMHPPGP